MARSFDSRDARGQHVLIPRLLRTLACASTLHRDNQVECCDKTMTGTSQALPHAGSYYAATTNYVCDFAQLHGAQSADVCVIGAGFTGISTALHLVERGYNVHVVEANRVGWGASGRNGGQFSDGITGEEKIVQGQDRTAEKLLWDMRWEGQDIILKRVHQYNIQCDLKFGHLRVAVKKRHLRNFQTQYEALEKHDFPFEFRLLSDKETQDLIGTSAYIGALMNMRNGHLHPLNLCIGEAMAAVSLGATIFEQSRVLRIEKGDRPKVITQLGSVSADFVVIAGNAYHSLELSLRSIMLPVHSFIIATEPLPEKLATVLNPRDLAVIDANSVLDYFRLSADQRLLFGGRCNYFGSDPEIIRKKLRLRMLNVYPQLSNLDIEFAWGGTIGVPFSRVPQLGRVAPNIFYCQGYSGHGVNVSHLAGQIMADAVSGILERYDMFARIKPITVPGAHRFSKPIIALGVLYNQLRDRL